MADSAESRQPFEMVASNVSLANSYRIELNKQVIGIATAIFAFTISFFHSDKTDATGVATSAPSALAWVGWIALTTAILCGLSQLKAWERFYLTYRIDNKGKVTEGTAERTKITGWRKRAEIAQYVALGIGLLCSGLFAALRLGG